MKLKHIALFFAVILFAISIPFAMHYNLNYDKYGTVYRDTDSVFIRLITVNAAQYNTSIRLQAAKYHRNVKIFVLPLVAELEYDWDIKIIPDDDTLHAFISKSQSSTAIRHCENFLVKLQAETEYNLVWRKS